jgi:hypothetical protein
VGFSLLQFRFLRRSNSQINPINIATPATPPTTPPAITPVLLEDEPEDTLSAPDSDEEVGVTSAVAEAEVDDKALVALPINNKNQSSAKQPIQSTNPTGSPENLPEAEGVETASKTQALLISLLSPTQPTRPL